MATTSRSSVSERAGWFRRGASRGQFSPTTALVTVAMLGIGVSLYAAVLADTGSNHERELAPLSLERVHEHLAPAGIARPTRLDGGTADGPSGYLLNVTLLADGHVWTAGPSPPPSATTATRRVPVRYRTAGYAHPGRLQVAVWR